MRVAEGQEVPIQLQVEDQSEGIFWRAQIYDDDFNLLATESFSEFGDGLYSVTGFNMPNENYIRVVAQPFLDSGFSSGSPDFASVQKIFLREDLPGAAEIADQVWDEALADHNAAGSMGNNQNRIDNIETDVGNLNDLSSADVQAALDSQGYTSGRAASLDNLDVAVSSRESESDASTRAATDVSEHNTTQAAISALNDLSEADLQSALDTQGYTSARASNLDNLDAAVTSRESEASASSRSTANQTEHEATQSAVAGLNDISSADVQAALTAQGLTSSRASNLDNLDASVSSRQSEADAATRAATNQSEHDASQAAIAALSIPTASEIADSVWNETLADHLTAGSTGFALSNVDVSSITGAINELRIANVEGLVDSSEDLLGIVEVTGQVTGTLGDD